MMLCQRDTTTQEHAATNSLADSKQMTSIKIKDEPNPLSCQSNQHLDIVDKQVIGAYGTTVKQECDSQEQEETALDTSGNSNDQVYSFKPYSQDDSCELNPEFAVICSFILQFGEALDLTLNIEQLKTSIEDQTRVDESLIDLHVKLLKKVRRYFVRDLWEKALIRYVSAYSYEDAYEIESLGYQKTRPSIKLQLLRRLMDAQFEHDQKFKAGVNLCDADNLRILPTGRDLRGNTYWHHTDQTGNLRIFQEPSLDYKSWKTICSSASELNTLIEELDKDKEERLKGEPILEPYNPLPEIFPELFVKEEIVQVEEGEPVPIKVSKTKKGRGNKGRGKKNEHLPVLKETEEEDNNSHPKPNSLDGQIDNNQITCNHNNIEDLPKSSQSTNTSIESQVRSTLEGLISKVVSSFEYIIRPLSRNSTQQAPEDIREDPVIKAPKKRATKRDKPKEEVVPRRSSSRIQQIQQKKIAEQEEEIKKMIESNAAKKTSSVASSLDDDSRSRSISSKTNRKRSESPEDNLKKNGKKRRKKGLSWRRGKGKKKLSWDKDDSDLSSTSSVTESNDEDDIEFEEEALKLETNDFDDEFACEDEDTNIEPVIIKRARTARQNIILDDPNESSIIEEDKPCGRCDKSNDPEWILLCDMCDAGYHTSCCLPPLMIVPDGDWFCPPCEHKMLLTKLRDLYTSTIKIIEAREREQMKAQKLRQANAKKEQMTKDPIAVAEKRPRDFLSELNEPLALQALDDELEEESMDESEYSYKQKTRGRARRKGAKNRRVANKRPFKDEDVDFGINRKKTRKNRTRRNVSDSEDESEDEIIGVRRSSNYSSEEDEDEVEEEEEEEELPKTRRARASVSYRFQEYDELIKSAIQGDSYDDDDEPEEDDKESSPDDDNCNYGRGKDMATIEALAYQQENGIIEQNSVPTDVDNPNAVAVAAAPPSKPKAKPRKKARRLNDLDAASESGNTTSDESFQASSATEAEDDEMTEAEISGEFDSSTDELVSSQNFRSKNKVKRKKRPMSYDSDDSEYQPTRTRRAASKRVSYKESTEDEDSETIEPSVRKTKKKDTLSSDDESQASWKSDKESVANDNEDDRSTSCAESPEMDADLVINEDEDRAEVSPPIRPDSKQTVQPPLENPLPSVPALIPLALQPPPLTSTAHVVVAKKAKIENSNHTLPQTSTYTTNCSILEESFDEIANPLYTQLLPPAKVTKPIMEQQGLPKIVGGQDKARDPIRELIQYCSESANSASMFNSYNQTLSNKNHPGTSPAHPSFYEEDDLK